MKFEPIDFVRIDGPMERGYVRLHNGARIVNSRVTGPVFLGQNSSITDAQIGAYNGFADNSHSGRAVIGSYCCVAAGAAINPYQHPTAWLSAHGFQYHRGGFEFVPEYDALPKLPYRNVTQREIRIGNDVWIGHNASVMANVGDGAVIGAGAVVTKDVRPYAVVAGNPATVRRYRFPRHIVERLLRLKWWDLELCDLAGLPFDNIERCLDLIEEKRTSVAVNRKAA